MRSTASSRFNPVTGVPSRTWSSMWPSSRPATTSSAPRKWLPAIEKIRAECDAQVKQFTAEGKLIEAQRIQQRTNYDIEMLTEVGICKGIENYSRGPLRPRARAVCPRPCWIISRRIFCCLWTRAMSPCHRCGPCTAATTPARKRWWSMASACPRPSITAR